MLRVCPLEWTDLNPTAPSFTPKNSSVSENKSKNNSNNGKNDGKDMRNKTSGAKALSTGSQSYTKLNDKKAIKTSTKSKPSVLTLNQFITEKLKIEEKPKIVSKNTNQNPNPNPKTQKKVNSNEVPNNSLDSSAPTRKRGKEREIPKPKKPTALKKIIINEKSVLNLNQEKSEENNGLNKVLDLRELNERLLHCKIYREYCCQRLTKSVDELVVEVLTDLVYFQDRMYSRDPMKAKMKKRLCFGFKEVTKYAKINKIKLLFIAPDVEKIESRGGLDDSLSTLLAIAKANATPVVFALSRRRLGITCKKKGFVSCIAVLDYDGLQEKCKELMALCENECKEYQTLSEKSLNRLQELPEEEITSIINGLPNIPQEFADFRNQLNPNDRRFVKLKKTNDK